MARLQARRHRRERLGGISLAVLGLVVLVVALFALHEPKGHKSSADPGGSSTANTLTRTPSKSASSTKKKPTTPATKPTGPTLSLGSSQQSGGSTDAAHSVPLVVLNSTTQSGLAKDAANRFEQGGWQVTDTGNIVNDILSTCAYYDPSDDAAKAAAEELQQQYPTIKRVEPKFAELPTGPVVVVLTSDYSSV